MAIIGLSSAATREVELSSDPDKGTDNATKFIIGSISARDLATIKDSSVKGTKSGGYDVKGNQASLEVVRRGLKGWKNLLDEEGKEIAFATEEVLVGSRKIAMASNASLDRLCFSDIQELHDLITGDNRLSEEERKN